MGVDIGHHTHRAPCVSCWYTSQTKCRSWCPSWDWHSMLQGWGRCPRTRYQLQQTVHDMQCMTLKVHIGTRQVGTDRSGSVRLFALKCFVQGSLSWSWETQTWPGCRTASSVSPVYRLRPDQKQSPPNSWKVSVVSPSELSGRLWAKKVRPWRKKKFGHCHKDFDPDSQNILNHLWYL